MRHQPAVVVMAVTGAEIAAALGIAEYIWRAREQGRPVCGAYYETRDPEDAAAICRRPQYHDPVSIDGRGHQPWPLDVDHHHVTGGVCPVADCTWPSPS